MAAGQARRPLRRCRSAFVLLSVVAAAALWGPAGASAAQSTYDSDTDTSEPAGYGSAPDQPHGGSSTTSSCTWTVKGRLYVRDPTLNGISSGEPLVGVAVKVSGADSVGTVADAFGKWETVYTDSDGEFSVTHTECNKRRVRVEAKFESASGDLRVLGPSSPEWYVIKDTNNLVDASTIDLKGEPFRGETGDQDTDQARTDAQTWVLYRKAIDYVTSLGYPFLNDVTVDNPAAVTVNDNSWTDPVFHGIHITPKATNDRWNMLHELGHAWAYPREFGEECLIAGAFGTDTSHGLREQPCVAFNEGFANFFASKLDEEMTAAKLLTSTPASSAPHTRAWLVSKGVLNLDDASHNDNGVDQAFRVLTQQDITSELFGNGIGATGGTASYADAGCAGHGVPTGLNGLNTALKVIGDANDQFDVQGAGRPTIEDLFARADERLNKFDDWDASYYSQIVDPSSDVEPHELYAC